MRISDWSSDVCSSDVDLAPRRVRIDAVRLVAMPDADHAEFAVVCRRGAYMRALARDIARTLGTAGHVGALRRTQVGPFIEEDALSLDELRAFGQIPAVLQHQIGKSAQRERVCQ